MSGDVDKIRYSVKCNGANTWLWEITSRPDGRVITGGVAGSEGAAWEAVCRHYIFLLSQAWAENDALQDRFLKSEAAFAEFQARFWRSALADVQNSLT